MRIGLTFNARPAHADQVVERGSAGPLALPGDDALEEFDSLETISAMAEAARSLGHEVELLGYGEQLLRRLLDGPPPDLVWNIAEGHGAGRSREARVPAVLEMLDIPYTGSDPLTLAATLDKDCAKRLVAAAGIATPAWQLVEPDDDAADAWRSLAELSYPVFVKPAFEGSSKGILSTCILHDAQQLHEALAQLWEAYRQPVLVEEFIDGDELTVGLVGNPPEVLGIMRVVPKEPSDEPFVYSLEVKRDYLRRARYECPAPLAAGDTRAVEQAALVCWRALGCRDLARIDFRLRRGVPYFLEANPLPGLSPVSGDMCILAGLMGVEYPELIGRILQAAAERCQLVDEASTAPR